MANYSSLTRREQVLARLREAADWVDGPELANERVGGSEGLKRLRELRQEEYGGHDIRMRRHPDPDRDVFQYRIFAEDPVMAGLTDITPTNHGFLDRETGDLIVYDEADNLVVDTRAMEQEGNLANPPAPEESVQPVVGLRRPMPLVRKADGTFEAVYEMCQECGGQFINETRHRASREHQQWLREKAKLRLESTEPEQTKIEVPPQPKTVRWTDTVPKFGFGEAVPCPACKGHKAHANPWIERRKVRHGPSATNPRGWDEMVETQHPADSFTGVSGRPGEPCHRCSGLGIVPNIGPVAPASQ